MRPVAAANRYRTFKRGARCQFWIQRLPLKRSAVSWPRGDSARLTEQGLASLDNSKLNAADLLAAVGELLKERYAIKSFVVRTKGRGFSYPVEDRIADEIAEQCDVVIAAIGD